MAWFFVIVNFYFDYIVAGMLGVLLGYFAAKAAIHLRFLESYVIINRVFMYLFLVCFTLLLCISYVASITDPDFSVVQRYRQAFYTIEGWFRRRDPLLEQGGLEEALRMTTDWVVQPELVFYTKGRDLFSVMMDGRNRQLRFTADGDIQQAVFSPDGNYIVFKTDRGLKTVSIFSGDEIQTAYDIPQDRIGVDGVKIIIGGIQWSPDSRRICFFVQKTSKSSSHTNWFVYDPVLDKSETLDLGPRQNVFLFWGKDSKRVYFFQARSAVDQEQPGYRIRWFEIPLGSGEVLLAADIFSIKTEVSDELLEREGVKIYRMDRRLRFGSSQDFRRNTPVVSASGRKIYVNKKQQLCYQSGYGVRYCLFGLATLDQYLTFPPKGRQSELLIQDVRWLSSERYVLMEHYTHGLLVLQPLARRVGVLAEGDIGIFGVYPE